MLMTCIFYKHGDHWSRNKNKNGQKKIPNDEKELK